MIASPEYGFIGTGVLFVLLVLGVPIGVALGIVGLSGLVFMLGFEAAIFKTGVVVFETLSKYELGVLPLFLLVAQLAFSSNASRDFFDAVSRFIGHKRGGLAFASMGGCAGFSAINGSSLATAATMGMVALPEMKRAGYSDSFSCGTVAAGGTLGPMIPPSAALIVFGIIAEQSIGRLFTAAIIPGLTQLLLYCAVIWLVVKLKPSIAPPTARSSWPERWEALRRIADLMVLVFVMVGGIVLGWFTPTQAASIGVVGALAICIYRKRFSTGMLKSALKETLKMSGLIYLIVIGALIFAVFMSVTGIATTMADLIDGLGFGTIGKLIVIALILLLMGSVLDGLALMLLMTPIFLPVVVEMGLSPIWFGIFLVRAMEIGFIHPPIGMNLYVIHSIAKDISLGKIFKGVVPFLLADLLHLLLLILFPAMVLFLPEILGR